MNISKKMKIAALSLTMGLGIASASASACSCEEWAKAERIRYCASVGGGSACASSPGLLNWLISVCKQNNYCRR